MSQRADETFEQYRKRQQTPLPGNRSGKSGAAFDELLRESIVTEMVLLDFKDPALEGLLEYLECFKKEEIPDVFDLTRLPDPGTPGDRSPQPPQPSLTDAS